MNITITCRRKLYGHKIRDQISFVDLTDSYSVTLTSDGYTFPTLHDVKVTFMYGLITE